MSVIRVIRLLQLRDRFMLYYFILVRSRLVIAYNGVAGLSVRFLCVFCAFSIHPIVRVKVGSGSVNLYSQSL